MEKKKSVSTDNQVVGNCEGDSQFCNGLAENKSQAQVKQYNRDTLLQLRLHPLSLQKPEHLPELKIVQEKLYLHDITDTTSNGKCVDTNSYHSPQKHEFCNMKHDYSVLPHYFNRMYPYCYPSHLYNGYQSNSSKYRPSYHLCNSLKKHCISSHPCYKDFSVDECLWAKQCYIPGDMCSPYSSSDNSNNLKKKDHIEAVPKRRKKLQIIDPNTGKNVLESVTETHSKQASVCSVEESSELSQASVTKDKYSKDYFCDTGVNEMTPDVPNEKFDDSATDTQGKVHNHRVKDSAVAYQADFCDKALEEISTLEKHVKALPTPELLRISENMGQMLKNAEDVQNCNASKCNMQEFKISQNRETGIPIDVHGSCQTHHKKDIFHLCCENVFRQTGAVRESYNHLDNQIRALKQEKQKVKIMQSFLRYKQYHLEETARNLDEKRLEIANWECNLFNETKRLHEKKQWAETKNYTLSNRTQQFLEKENILNKNEIGISGDASFLSSGIKENEFPERKFSADICNDSTWNDIPKTTNYKNNERDESSYLRYVSNPSNISENATSSNVEQCRSEACLLDELEKNIVFIERMNLLNEVSGSSVDNKTEQSSSNAIQKSDESAAYDPTGYSKGRRYLPEHIKYWLNKHDKSGS